MEVRRIAPAQRVQQGATGEAVAAQAVQDRRGKPPIAANDGSVCSGLRSPESRYTNAWSGEVWYVTS